VLKLPKRLIKRLGLLALSPFYFAAGINHFVNPDFYLAIMPPYLPGHLALVYLSGVFEVVGGIAVLVPGTRALAGWGLIFLLIAIFPANIHMALHADQFPDVAASALYGRLPLQFLLMAWAYWATRPEELVD